MNSMHDEARTRAPVVIAACGVWLGCVFLLWWFHRVVSSRQILENIVTSYLLGWGFYWLVSGRSTVEKALRFFTSTMSLLLLTAVLEFLAFTKAVDYRLVFKTPAQSPSRSARNVLDPELLHIHKPYLHSRGSSRGDIAKDWGLSPAPSHQFDVRVDRNGFRNPTDYQSADLIVIGDSFVEAWNVPEKELLTTHLAGLTGKTVANLGQSAYGPQQELHVLRRYGLALQPKICLWLFFEGNDLHDIHNYTAAITNWNQYSLGVHSFSQRCFTRNLLWALLRRFRPPVRNPNVVPSSGLFVPAQGNSVRMYFMYSGAPLSDMDLKALEETKSVFARAQELCQTHAIELVVAFVPTKFRVYKTFCEFDADSACRGWVLNDLPQRIQSAVQDLPNHVRFVDLTPALVEQAAKGSLVYFPDDTHWSPEGHRVAAQTLADFLKQPPTNE